MQPGFFYHFLDEKQVRLIAVEAAGEGLNSGRSAATTRLGSNGILHGSRSLVMQTTDGQIVEPHSISAGTGLSRHWSAPRISFYIRQG